MKKLVTFLLILFGLMLYAQETKSIYYYLTAWESQPQTERAKKIGEKPLYTNVVQLRFKCIDGAGAKLEQRLDEFYKINDNSLNIGYGALVNVKAVGPFNTFEEAYEARGKNIVELFKHHRIHNPVSDFWISCPEK